VTPSLGPALHLNLGKAPFGDAAQWNQCLVADLKDRKLWDNHMAARLQEAGGSIQRMDAIPVSLKEIYRIAQEIEPRWLIECAARRQKWLDMSQALTLYVSDTNLASMSEIYTLAWEKGLKTTRQAPAPAGAQNVNAALALEKAQTPAREEPKKSKLASAGAGPMLV
jgi:ribonucleoside-diphosphate reductase alpha chain